MRYVNIPEFAQSSVILPRSKVSFPDPLTATYKQQANIKASIPKSSHFLIKVAIDSFQKDKKITFQTIQYIVLE